MKKIIVLLVCFSTVMLSGCKNEEVTEDQRMADTRKVVATKEYNRYIENILDSGFNWYSQYVNTFLESIKPHNYSVDAQSVKLQLSKVEQKLNEVKNINVSSVKKAYDDTAKDLTKNDTDKEFIDSIEKDKAEIETNKKNMVSILKMIDENLKLGLDGSYSKEDLDKISKSQTKIIEIFDTKIKNNY